MTVRLYRSVDSSAPVLTGQVGTLITVLDAVLVNGYGSQTAAGWTKPYTGTNTAVFRMATSGNSGFYLDVNDNGPGSAAAREARMRGYETMSAVATGTNPFPTAAQITNGIILRKSSTADSTARAWYCLANGSVFYFFVETPDFIAPQAASPFAFGDFTSYKTSDAYNCLIMGAETENSPGTTNTNFARLISNGTLTVDLTSTSTGHYVARSSSGVAGSLAMGKHTDCSKFNYNYLGFSATSGCMTYPNAADNGLYLAPLWIHHGGVVRGHCKGIWAPMHNLPFSSGDTFTGTGNLASKTFFGVTIPTSSSGVNRGCVALETSDTWS